jgi:glycosyltransferase involved in cell wall biosynthesis
MSRAWKDEHEVTTVLLIGGMEKNYALEGRVIELAPRGRGVAGKALAVLRRIRRAKKLRRTSAFDAVISFGSAANAVNVLSRCKERIILTEHNIKSQENRSWGIAGHFYDAAIRVLYNRADAVVAISRAMKEDLELHYGVQSVELLHNPHDLEDIAAKGREPLPSHLASLAQSRYIVSVGPTDERKGFWRLVRAFAEARKLVPDLKLVLVGKEGPLHSEIVRLCEDLGAADSVIFAGFLRNPYPVMARAALYACASLREGLPNVIIESLALGVPVVSTDCVSGPREILQHNPSLDGSALSDEMVDCGALVPVFTSGYAPEEPVSREELLFSRALCGLLLDPVLHEKAKSAALLRSRDFSARSIMARYASLCMKENG